MTKVVRLRSWPLLPAMKTEWRALVLFGLAALLAGCQTTRTAEPAPQIVPNPNFRVGSVVWVDTTADYAVVRTDQQINLGQSFLLVIDPTGQSVAGVLLSLDYRQGQSVGARLVEGLVEPGFEVRLPGEEWTNFLARRYR